MFSKKSSEGYKSPLEGIEQKTLVYGEKTLMTEFHLKKGATIPRHHHPHEQTGYLVSGTLRFYVDGKTFDCEPGDSWCIAGDAEHGVEILDDAVVIEVFAPVRTEYLP